MKSRLDTVECVFIPSPFLSAKILNKDPFSLAFADEPFIPQEKYC